MWIKLCLFSSRKLIGTNHGCRGRNEARQVFGFLLQLHILGAFPSPRNPVHAVPPCDASEKRNPGQVVLRNQIVIAGIISRTVGAKKCDTSPSLGQTADGRAGLDICSRLIGSSHQAAPTSGTPPRPSRTFCRWRV